MQVYDDNYDLTKMIVETREIKQTMNIRAVKILQTILSMNNIVPPTNVY